MMRPSMFGSMYLVGALLLAGCAAKEEAPGKRYEISGNVISVDADKEEVTLQHEEIPGFMGAMTMPYPLADRWAFSELEAGDHLEGTLVVSGKRYWIENVILSRKSGASDTVSGIPDPEPGTPVPGFTLVNQDGQPIEGDGYRGKTLVLTFVYSRCPLEDFCPRMTQNFAGIEKALRNDSSLYERTHLLTISFDPEYDTPERLKQYAHQEGVQSDETFRHWEFATGKAEDIRALANFFALDYWTDQDQILHTLRTAVIAPDGRLFKLYRGNSWRPEQVIADIREVSSREARP